MPTAAAVGAASWDARRYLVGGSGGLVHGGSADLVVLRGDPRRDIRTLLDPVAIVLRGTVVG